MKLSRRGGARLGARRGGAILAGLPGLTPRRGWPLIADTMTRASILAFALLASLSLPSLARADVPPPNVAGCDMKKAGDACVKDDDSDGSCVQQKCSKLDYSNGTPPTSVEYDCLLCSGPPAAPNDTANDTADAADDGCSVALPGVTASSMGAGAAIAAALLWMRRRRSKKS